MELYTNDYLEYYLTLVGWLINGGIWDMIADTGLIAVPITAIVSQEWLRARGEGADEGNKGALALARTENRIYVGILVIMLGLIPIAPVSFQTIQFDQSRSKQCQYDQPLPSEASWAASFSTLNGKSANIPLWWALIHGLSKAATAASVAAIPCGVDLQQIRMDVDANRIADPLLAQEVADFTNDCYGRARAKLFMTQPRLTADEYDDVTWIGSKFFLTTSGYYDDGFSGFRSHTPRVAWPYDATRDAGLAQTTGGGGYPTCKQWWSDGGIGLRARLLAQVKPDLLTDIKAWATSMSQEDINDQVIRDLVSPRKQALTQGQVYSDYGGAVDGTMANSMNRLAATAGQAVGSLAMYPAVDSMRQAAPMVLSFLKMALIICIPFVLVFGTLDLKVAMTLTFAQFALIFVDFWLQLARWVDSTILNALYGTVPGASPHQNFNLMMGAKNTQGDLLLDFVMGTMFLVLPVFWVTMLTLTGFKVGGLVSGLTEGTKQAQAAGAKGGKELEAAGKQAI